MGQGITGKQIAGALTVVVLVLVVVVAVVAGRGEPTAAPPAGLPRVEPGPEDTAPSPERTWAVDDDVSVPDMEKPSLEPGRLEIPSIGVAAELVSTRVENGEFIVPDPQRVGIHRSGTSDELDARLAPGQGTLLASGHVTWNGELGALYELHRVEPGALIHTSDAHGQVQTWVAVELRVVPHDQLPADLLDAGGERRLVVVTCAGEVIHDDAGRRVYADNLVVTAVPG